jgi:metal-dependent amidase/aminoacylase/carboxypeptidase family protein
VGFACDLFTRIQDFVQDINRNSFAALTHRDFYAGELGALYTNCVNIRLEVKTCDIKMRDQIVEDVKKLTDAERGASQSNMKASIRVHARAPATINDTELAETVQRSFGHYFGDRFWIPPMEMPVEDFPVLGGSFNVLFVCWKLGSIDPAQWDEAASKGGDILENLPTNHSPWFSPAPELTVLTGKDAMSLAS